ncbi:K(+)-transporting ATPase subunit F [Streptomyces sp. NP160]|nr:K(+)-transporting ATPase subunit F [Streptomyces sp. NP160]TNM59770.1 K(+)-transporting ATPase subunit F [Streptomyces sp. NP160]
MSAVSLVLLLLVLALAGYLLTALLDPERF